MFFLVGTCRCFLFLLDVVCFFVLLFYRLVLLFVDLFMVGKYFTEVFSHFSHVFLWNGSPVSLYPHPVPFHIDSRCLQTSIGSTSKVEEVRCRAFVLFGVQWKHPKMDGFIWFPSSVQLLESRGLFSDMLGSGSVKQSVQEIKWYEKRCFPYIMLCYIADHRILSQDFHSKLFCFNPCHMLHAHRASTALTASWQNLVFFEGSKYSRCVGVFENRTTTKDTKEVDWIHQYMEYFGTDPLRGMEVSRQPDLTLGLAERIRKPCPLEAQLVSRCSVD